jgi:hypothetical protein
MRSGPGLTNERALKKVQAMYEGQGRAANWQAAKGTAWGLLCSVTEFVDHERRARSQEYRLDSAWFGQGQPISSSGLWTMRCSWWREAAQGRRSRHTPPRSGCRTGGLKSPAPSKNAVFLFAGFLTFPQVTHVLIPPFERNSHEQRAEGGEAPRPDRP